MLSAQPPALSDPQIQTWTGRQFAARVDEAMDIYVRAMQYPGTPARSAP